MLTVATDQLNGAVLRAHLMRRAGFGATADELDAISAKTYEDVVEELLEPDPSAGIDCDVVYRFLPEIHGQPNKAAAMQAYWLYLMINSKQPLVEKMALFWHHLFATGYVKSGSLPAMRVQLEMFRRNALSDLRTILVALAKDPAMIVWLDNQENTNEVHNENFGRELLELFSMGVGNYTEDDVKSSARAFTGWGLKEPAWRGPYGFFPWEFKFHEELHDFTEKEFLGDKGNFDGQDIVDRIVRQPATARFIARRLYLFFVSDTPDEAAIDELADVFRRTDGDIKEVVRALLLSKAFRSKSSLYAKVKSPVEHVVGLARFTEDFPLPDWKLIDLVLACKNAGQELLNPPSVEGWHVGKEWISTGTLMVRVNFAADMVGRDTPGLRRVVARLRAMGVLEPEHFVDACLEFIGPLVATPTTYSALLDLARRGGRLDLVRNGETDEERVRTLLQLAVASREFQYC